MQLPLRPSPLSLYYISFICFIVYEYLLHSLYTAHTHTYTHTVAIGQRLRHNAPKLYSTCWQAREVSSRAEEGRRGSGIEEGGWVVACNSNSCSMDWQNLLALLSCLQAKADYLLAIGISLSICLLACLPGDANASHLLCLSTLLPSLSLSVYLLLASTLLLLLCKLQASTCHLD